MHFLGWRLQVPDSTVRESIKGQLGCEVLALGSRSTTQLRRSGLGACMICWI
jgi:hypothetical protein